MVRRIFKVLNSIASVRHLQVEAELKCFSIVVKTKCVIKYAVDVARALVCEGLAPVLPIAFDVYKSRVALYSESLAQIGVSLVLAIYLCHVEDALSLNT